MPPSVYFWVRFASTDETAETDQYRLMELGALGAEEETTAPAVRGYFGDVGA